MLNKYLFLVFISFVIASCNQQKAEQDTLNQESETISSGSDSSQVKPVIVTDQVANDSDDPAIWIHPDDPSQSLILGTDKGNEQNIGAIYVFDLQGNIIADKTIPNIQRPNNIDVEYGFLIDGDTIDIAVFTERYAEAIRVLKVPEMELIDGGGIKVFTDESGPEFTNPMGIAIYKNPESGKIYAMVGRKNGPPDNYLWQYALNAENGLVKGEKVRSFGQFSGKNEIEAIAVDDALGYVYYSDEGYGIRKYYAHPDSSNQELALFGTKGFQEDHEGISIYQKSNQDGYILVSDQQDNSFRIFSRTGTAQNPHQHSFIREIKLSTVESDGSDATSMPIGNQFPHGLFVAMSDDGTFHYYDWRDIMEK